MRPLKGICRGCTRVVEAATLDGRRRCLKCAKLVPTRECPRCRDQRPEQEFLEGPECAPCDFGENPVIPRTREPGTWPTSDGWRRLPCRRCDTPFWSLGLQQRLCHDCRVLSRDGEAPEYETEWICVCCVRCGIYAVFGGLCEECEQDIKMHPDGLGRRLLQPIAEDEDNE